MLRVAFDLAESPNALGRNKLILFRPLQPAALKCDLPFRNKAVPVSFKNRQRTNDIGTRWVAFEVAKNRKYFGRFTTTDTSMQFDLAHSLITDIFMVF